MAAPALYRGRTLEHLSASLAGADVVSQAIGYFNSRPSIHFPGKTTVASEEPVAEAASPSVDGDLAKMIALPITSAKEDSIRVGTASMADAVAAAGWYGCRAVRASSCFLMLVDERAGSIISYQTQSQPGSEVADMDAFREVRKNIPKGFKDVLRKGRPVFTSDVAADDRFSLTDLLPVQAQVGDGCECVDVTLRVSRPVLQAE